MLLSFTFQLPFLLLAIIGPVQLELILPCGLYLLLQLLTQLARLFVLQISLDLRLLL